MSKLIVGNLKMNLLTIAERDCYLKSFEKDFKKMPANENEIVLCPPAVHLEKFSEMLKMKNVFVGAQNIFWEERGSYTGEISSLMVKNIGCKYVILGHSERRKYFAESNENINSKIKSALKDGLVPIVCIGETREERENGDMVGVIVGQITESLEGIPVSKISEVVFAYEPVWAVGSDVTATSDEILEVRITIKKSIVEKYGTSLAEKLRILYGGSVNSKNIIQVCVDPKMDGVLVGRESLASGEFLKIVETVSEN